MFTARFHAGDFLHETTRPKAYAENASLKIKIDDVERTHVENASLKRYIDDVERTHVENEPYYLQTWKKMFQKEIHRLTAQLERLEREINDAKTPVQRDHLDMQLKHTNEALKAELEELKKAERPAKMAREDEDEESRAEGATKRVRRE
jgi:hypothetical protein